MNHERRQLLKSLPFIPFFLKKTPADSPITPWQEIECTGIGYQSPDDDPRRLVTRRHLTEYETSNGFDSDTVKRLKHAVKRVLNDEDAVAKRFKALVCRASIS